MSDYVLTPENYDGVVSALLGNGELCTTVGPTGYHTPPDQQTDIAHKTQHFVMAGRRRSGPGHPLINFGYLWRTLVHDGIALSSSEWTQMIVDEVPGYPRESARCMEAASILRHERLGECCRSFISLKDNAFIGTTDLDKFGVARRRRPEPATLVFEYRFGDADVHLRSSFEQGVVRLRYVVEEYAGDVWISYRIHPDVVATVKHTWTERGVILAVDFSDVRKMSGATILVHFTDRLNFQHPFIARPDRSNIATFYKRVRSHASAAEDFWSSSDMRTGNNCVDHFRVKSLYTLRCQSTPWSIPPTVSEPYWGAGTFHDEMYPFLGLLSSNHVELAERVPYFRLTTLPQAMQRGRGKGALYPWSSTEYGEERDPNGLWLTERFHLGQFAVCVWMLWLYNRDRVQLDDLYPVLKETARFFELNMLERDEKGSLRTKACVDFDESVGEVTNGPFTICAAIASMEYAANAAEILDRDAERGERWRRLADELRSNLPSTDDEQRPSTSTSTITSTNPNEPRTQRPNDLYAIPDGKPLHYSILGPIFPFRIDVDSLRARASAAYIHEACRSTKGWKPGFSDVFEGSNWMWTAAHLGIVHALQGNGDLAWEAIKEAPASAGPLLSPNEHVDKDGVIHVPWFTTGCGAWLYALNCLFVQMDEEGTILLPAIPGELPNASFRDLRAERGVLVSGAFKDGKLISLTARSPKPISWRFRLPAKYANNRKGNGIGGADGRGTVTIDAVEVGTEPTALL